MPLSRNRLRSSSPAAAGRTGPIAMIGSVLLHGSIVAATFFTWTHTLDIDAEELPIVPVELVTIADTTSIAAQSPEPPPPEPQEMAAVQTAPPPPPEKVEVAPEAPPAPKPVEKAPPPAPPKAKPTPPKPKQDQFDINNIMALLDKKTPAKAQSAPVGDRSVRGAGPQDAMTMQLGDALRNMIAQCWNPPVGSPNPEQLIVTYRMFLNPDGSVARTPQLAADSASAASRDAFTRAAADAAMRAIYACAPYKLPENQYSAWREIEVTFDPRRMAGVN